MDGWVDGWVGGWMDEVSSNAEPKWPLDQHQSPPPAPLKYQQGLRCTQ